MLLDITFGVTETPSYKAWKFPGGEIHFKLKESFAERLSLTEDFSFLNVNCRLNNSEDIIFLGIVLGTLAKDYDNRVNVFIPYFPYQQADRDFAVDECFSLITITKILNSYPRHSYFVYDPHSDVTPALLAYMGDTGTITNHEFIKHSIAKLTAFHNNDAYEGDEHHWNHQRDLIILAPDAGAYKKIFKLTKDLGFKGRVEVANKYRNPINGDIEVRISADDFDGKEVLIIDDICVGGRTFIELAKQLVTKNVGNLHLAVSHGIFSNGYAELEKHFQHIFTTNSIRDNYESEHVEVYEII